MIFYGVTNFDRQLLEDFSREKNVKLGSFESIRFPDRELSLIVNDDVAGEDCVIIGSTAPPLEQFFQLLMLADALKRAGSSYVQAFIPYMGYSRQDSNAANEWGGIEAIGRMLKTAGVDSIITIDIHSRQADKLIDMPVINLYPVYIFGPLVKRLGWQDYCVLAPDEGAKIRARALALYLGEAKPVSYMIKRRIDSIIQSTLTSNICDRVAIVDDILDSGKTLVSACNLLKNRGVKEITVIVTHGLFNNSAWRRLFALNVTAIYVSDSTPNAFRQHHPNIVHVPILPMLEAAYPNLILEEKRHEKNVI